MPTTPLTSTPYPTGGDVPDGPVQMRALAEKLEQFAIPRFASTGARDTAFSGITLAADMLAYVNGVLYHYNGSAWEAMSLGAAAWSNFTPTWTSSGTAPALGNGTASGRYVQIGKTVHAEFFFQLGSTSTIGTGNYSFALPPVAAANTIGSSNVRGAVWFRDSSASGDYTGFLFFPTTTTFQVRLINAFPSNALLGSASPVVPAVSDFLSGSFTYEAA